MRKTTNKKYFKFHFYMQFHLGAQRRRRWGARKGNRGIVSVGDLPWNRTHRPFNWTTGNGRVEVPEAKDCNGQ